MTFDPSKNIEYKNDYAALDDALVENPFNTAIGQQVVSEAENYWARIARTGTYKTACVQSWTAQPTLTSITPVSPSQGKVMILKRAEIGCKVGSIFFIAIDQGDGRGPQSFSTYHAAGNPLVRDYNGDIVINAGGSFQFQYLSDSTLAGGVWAGLEYFEVDPNV